MGDSKFTACHSNSFSVSGDVLALEAHGLKPVGSSRSLFCGAEQLSDGFLW